MIQALTIAVNAPPRTPQRYIAVLSHEPGETVLWAEWKLFSVANLDGDPQVFVGDMGPTKDFLEASLRAEGHVKQSGCHEFTVPDYHGCTPADLDGFMSAIQRATRAAADLLTGSHCEWNPESRRAFEWWCPNCATIWRLETAEDVDDATRNVDGCGCYTDTHCPMCESEMWSADEAIARTWAAAEPSAPPRINALGWEAFRKWRSLR